MNFYRSKVVTPKGFSLTNVDENSASKELQGFIPGNSNAFDYFQVVFENEGAEQFHKSLTCIINLSLNTQEVLLAWKMAK